MKSILFIPILAILYFLAGYMSFDLVTKHSFITMGAFLPEGIALAFVLFFGKKAIFGVFIGQFFLAYNNGVDISAAIGISLVNSLEAYLAILLFKKFKINIELKTLRDMIGFTLIVGLVLQVFSAVFSNMILLVFDEITTYNIGYLIFSWWFGNTMGQLLITPFLLILFTKYKVIHWRDYLLYMVLISVYLYTIEIIIRVANPFLFFSLSIPIALLLITKKGIVYGSLFVLIAAFVTTYSAYLGNGSFHINSTIDNTINYNLFILSHISIILMFSVLFEEKKNAEESLKELIDKEVAKNREQQLLMLQQNRLAQMGEMISMIAHQWRQPLNNLSLINQLLISQYNKGKLDVPNLTYFKNNSKKQIDLMSQTIDDFRNFFKEEKDKKEFVLNEIIQSTLDMTKSIYTSSGVKIDFCAEGLFKTQGYPNTLAQAILNIINNARDALDESDTEDKRINICLIKYKEYAEISIKDNAGGIPLDIIDKIFDPYFSTKLDKNGTGLGLYMTQLIIKDQGHATISVSNDSHGANFKITLKGEWYVDS